MSSIAKTHVARSKSGIRSASALNRSDMKRGTMTIRVSRSKSGIRSASALNRSDMKRGTMTIRVFIMTNLTDNGLPKEGAMQEE
jgi:hypothetical protein